MKILAFNGSPRKKGNTSTIIGKILEGARSKGAETVEVRLHDLNWKGCMGCLNCREHPGQCKAKDDFSPYLEALKSSEITGVVVGCPIYMYRITGQMKLMIDRFYSLYASNPRGGYRSMVPAGKKYALVVSQGAPNTAQYEKSIRYLSGMTGSGLGMKIVGRILQDNSNAVSAVDRKELLEEAYLLGQKLAK